MVCRDKGSGANRRRICVCCIVVTSWQLAPLFSSHECIILIGVDEENLYPGQRVPDPRRWNFQKAAKQERKQQVKDDGRFDRLQNTRLYKPKQLLIVLGRSCDELYLLPIRS